MNTSTHIQTLVTFSYISKHSNENTYRDLYNSVPEEIRSKADKYRMRSDALACLLGRMLLRDHIYFYNLNLDLSQVQYTEFKKPYFENLFFNISHSSDIVVCASSLTGEVGIDIEHIKPIELNDFKESFSRSEFQSLGKNYERFYYIWTAKEATVKADGKGLHIPLKDVTLSDHASFIGNKKWNLFHPKINKSYVVCLATEHPASIEIQEGNFLK